MARVAALLPARHGARTRFRPCFAFAAGLLVTLAVLPVLVVAAPPILAQGARTTSSDDKGILADLISRALSTPSTRVSVGDIEGALSSDATIRDIEISDRDGVWLRLDRARIVWRRLALLQRRLEIDQLELGTLDIRRRPIPAETSVAGENEPLLPVLPVKVEIKAFALGQLMIGEPILGTAARVAATGAARLGNEPADGLDLTLDARRLDAAGTLTARLGLVPQGQRLTLKLALDEPEGGILARAGSIPGLPPVKFDVDGQGSLDAFQARLAFDAGPEIGATGGATLARDGGTRRLDLDLQARIGGLLPALAAPVFAGTTRLTGQARFGDDGAVALNAISLAASLARLEVSGRIGADRVADVTVTAANVPAADGMTAAGAGSIRRLALDGRVTGPLAAPNVQARLAVEDARLTTGRLARLEATLTAAGAGTGPNGATRLRVSADGRATGLSLADPALARAVGDSIVLAARGSADTAATLDLESATVTTPTLKLSYAGRLGSDEIRGRLSAEAESLRALGGIARLPGLAGSGSVMADLEGTPRANRINAVVTGRATSFASGIAATDGLFGGALGLDGTIRIEPTGGYGLENVRLTGPGASARVNGRLEQESADLAVEAAIPDLARSDARLTGRAELAARVTGGLQRPGVDARIALADATALGRAVPRLALTIAARDVTGALDGTVVLDGLVDGRPARGGFRLARVPGGSTSLDGLDLAVGSATIRGGVRLDAASLASGRITLDAGSLADLSALLLTEATGALNADVTLEASGGRQGARIQARGERIGLYGVAIERAEADLSAADLYRRPVLSGTAAIDAVTVGAERVERVRLDLVGTPEASDVTLSAQARGFSLDGRARVIPSDPIRVELTQFTGTRGGQRLALGGPASLSVRDGGVDIATLPLTLGGGRLTIVGFAGQRLDLRLDAARLPLAAADLFQPGLGLSGTVDGEARLGGTTAALTGDVRLRLNDLAAPATRAARLPGVSGTLVGRFTGERIVLDGTALAAGRLAEVKIDGSAPLGSYGLLDLRIAGRGDAAVANGFVRSDALRLSGPVEFTTNVAGTTAQPDLSFEATATRFTTGLAPADGLLGGRWRAQGRLSVPPLGGYRVTDLLVAGAHVTARIDGSVTPDRSDLRLTAQLPDLRRADARLSGRADATAQISGTLDRPDATARIAVADATALGRPIPRVSLDVAAQDLLGALDARIVLDGEVDRRPARGRVRVMRPADGSTVLDGLDLQVGSARATGDLRLDANAIGGARLVVNAPNLDDLTPLLLVKAAGSLDLDVRLDVVDGGQNAAIKLDAERIGVGEIRITKADADLRVVDLYRRPVISGTAALDDAVAGGERISRVRLTARGSPQASDVTLTAQARDFDLDAQARVVPAERIRIEVARLGATRGRERLVLAGPATLTVVDGGLDLRNVAVALGAGRITLEGLVGSRLDLRAAARAVPLAAAEIVLPGLGLAGTFEGQARITGPAAAPSGEYRARIDGLAAPQTRSLGLPRIDVTAQGRLDGGRATVDANVTAGRAGSLRIGGSLPTGGAGALDLAIKGSVDAGAATTGLLAADGRRLTGRVDVDARVGGTLAAPEASGAATLAGGTFTDATQGTQFRDIRARIVARGPEITVENGSATARNGGQLTASGRVRLDPGAGFPGEIRIGGRNAELVRSGLVTAIANLNVTASGALARAPQVGGRVEIVAADVTVPENLPGTLKPLPGTRHVNPTRTTRARLALEARQKGRGGQPAPAFDAALDLTLAAPGRIFVRGRGLNAEVGGTLRLTGTLDKPVPNGAFDLRQGTFQALTSRLNFSRGRVTFAGDLTPELDFAATTNAGGAAITVTVVGPANDLQFAFTSSPSLPQDEVLSRLLFNSPSGQLSPFQALALAQAAAQYGGGEGSFEDLRRSLGLTGLDVNLGGSGGVNVGLQRALGNRLSVGVRAGATAGTTGVGADLRVTDEIRVQGEVGATGGASLGIGAQYEW